MKTESQGVKDDGDDKPSSSGYIFAPVSYTVLRCTIRYGFTFQCTHELTCPYVRKGKSYCRFGQRSHLSICQVSHCNL